MFRRRFLPPSSGRSPLYQTRRRNILEDGNLHTRSRKTLKSRQQQTKIALCHVHFSPQRSAKYVSQLGVQKNHNTLLVPKHISVSSSSSNWWKAKCRCISIFTASYRKWSFLIASDVSSDVQIILFCPRTPLILVCEKTKAGHLKRSWVFPCIFSFGWALCRFRQGKP
jgi:hypothetical protein